MKCCVCACACIQTYTHTGMYPAAGEAVGCAQGEGQSNFHRKPGLLVTVWSRYTVPVLQSYFIHHLTSVRKGTEVTCSVRAAEVSPEAERVVQLLRQHQHVPSGKKDTSSDATLTPRWALQSTTSWNYGIFWCIKYKNGNHFCPISCDWHQGIHVSSVKSLMEKPVWFQGYFSSFRNTNVQGCMGDTLLMNARFLSELLRCHRNIKHSSELIKSL